MALGAGGGSGGPEDVEADDVDCNDVSESDSCEIVWQAA